jgi:type I restriction enzyme, S subunit
MVMTARNTKLKPGYKQTEVGMIPEDWEIKKLEEIGECLIGLTYQPSDVKSDGLLVLRASNVGDSGLIFTDNVFVDVEVSDKLILRKDDILICVRNGSRNLIGKCALIDDRAKGMTFGAFMSIFRTKYAHFVFYQFQSKLIKRQIHENIGATINQITNKNLNSFQIPIPKEEKEQRAIATTLSDVDALVTSLDKLIAKKRDIKQATMQRLLTGKRRLPEFGGELKPGYKQTELGIIPEDWRVQKMNIVADVRDGTHDSPKYIKQGVRFITSKNIVNGMLDFSEVSYISEDDANEVNKRSKVDRGDLLMSMIGTIGNAVLIDFEPDFCIKNVALIKPFKQIISGNFLIHLLSSPVYQQYLLKKLDGGIQKFISLGALRNLYVLLPSSELEQTAIATVLSDMDAEIAALEQKRHKTRALKQGMMQELLTGKTRLV